MNSSIESFACGVLAGAIIASVLSYLLWAAGPPSPVESIPVGLHGMHPVWVEPGPEVLSDPKVIWF